MPIRYHKPMMGRTKVLSHPNIDKEIRDFRRLIAKVGNSVSGLSGISFFEALKRAPISAGQYEGITLYEASNRIMTDLVILYGVRWLLRCEQMPYTEFRVDYGNENTQRFDVMATHSDGDFSGEAFNVAPSYFTQKYNKEIAKLRAHGAESRFRALLINNDAVNEDSLPTLNSNEFFLLVNPRNGRVKMASNNRLQPTLAPSCRLG